MATVRTHLPAGPALIALALLCATCGGGASPPEAMPARVRVAAIGWDADGLAGLSVLLNDGSGPRDVLSASLTADEDYGQPHSPWFPTASTGELTVRVRIEQPAGDPVTRVVTLPLRADWAWELQVVRAAEDPLATCFGCVDSERLTPGAGSEQAIWLVWGDNSISAPVVY